MLFLFATPLHPPQEVEKKGGVIPTFFMESAIPVV